MRPGRWRAGEAGLRWRVCHGIRETKPGGGGAGSACPLRSVGHHLRSKRLWGLEHSPRAEQEFVKDSPAGFPGGSLVKNLPAVQEAQVRSLGREDPLEKGMATLSSILAWRIPWTEEPGGLQSSGLPRVGHYWATNTSGHLPGSRGRGGSWLEFLEAVSMSLTAKTTKLSSLQNKVYFPH